MILFDRNYKAILSPRLLLAEIVTGFGRFATSLWDVY